MYFRKSFAFYNPKQFRAVGSKSFQRPR